MKKLLALYISLSLFTACDDGDVIVTSFDFETATLENCGEPGGYVFFRINSEAQESISLRLNTQDELFIENGTVVYTLDGTSNFVNYRKYDGAIASDYFCSEIPPTSPNVSVDFFGASGTAQLITVVTLDDNDGVPSMLLSDDPLVEGTGDLDGDGIPNYYDFDDDGDNVPTSAELDIADLDGDGDPLTNPLNTDSATGDILPNYLDADDDGDGVLTINEDLNGNLNPADDVADPMIGPNFLNMAVVDENIIEEYRIHTYTLSSDIRLQLENLVLVTDTEQITQEFLDMGEKQNVINAAEITDTPDFN